MNFKLTSQQKNFYEKRISTEYAIWNHGVIDFFNEKYSYEQLNKAFNRLIETFEPLRLRISATNNEIVSYIEEFRFTDYPFLQFSSDYELTEATQKFINEPIDPYGVLFKCVIFHTPSQSGFLICAHHIIIDGFSTQIMADFFDNYLNDRPYIPEKIQSYEEYVKAEETYKISNRYNRDRKFWEKQFSTEPTFSVIPQEKTDFDYTASEKNIEISHELFVKTSEFCNKNDISLNSFFNAIYGIYFSQKYEVDNFTIGVPVFNRTTVAELNTIGLYMHVLPLVLNITPDTFLEYAKKIEDCQLNLYRHQKFTQNDIKDTFEELGKPINSLFDIVCDYQEFQKSDNYEFVFQYSNALSTPLEIHLQSFNNEKHNLKIRYRTALFTEQEIEVMLNSIVALIENALENPDKNIFELEMISKSEKQKILCDFNNTKVDYPREKCIHELFEEQVERTPDKVAVVASDKKFTYKELNEEANRIANNLINQGIGKSDIVGLMLPRKSYLLSALFGILKTGAAYLPIDMELPKERIEYMCQDTNTKLVVSEENISSLMQSDNISNPKVDMANDSLCYCIYTSGSTGQPKGVMARHRNVVNYISKNEHNIFGKIVKEDFEAIVSISTCSFDIFVTETIATLVNGLRVVLADEQECRNQYALNRLLTREKGEFLQTTPTKLKVLTKDPSQREFLKNVKAILLGGEAMERAYLDELKELTNAKIYNIYGVTEVPIWSAFADTDTFTDAITIGRGIANTQIYIVDKYLKPVPIGMMGELCIAGESVSSGYLNQPELTKEKFIDNPFGSGKLYRTGDHAYWREDGNLVFIGRKDFQVKIRGLRIELGEIESVIQAIDGIERAVVVVRKDKEDRQLICAFYTGTEINAKEFRTILSSKLPKYMVPHIFTHLDNMPLTSSGKANRNALPKIDLENISTETEYVAPQTTEEEILTQSIEAVLDIEKVSVMDNFFDMGGDSLKSIELVSELEDKGYTVNVKSIFEAKDIQSLAKELIIKTEKYEKVEYSSIIPATAAQMRIYTSQIMSPKSVHYNIVAAFKAEDLDVERLKKAVNELVVRHEGLRTSFENRDGQIVQVINDTATIELQKLNSEEISLINTPFDLSISPLLKVGYHDNTVMVVAHHIIVDGESMTVLCKELNELYMGRELPETVQYGEFAVTDSYTEENEKYWLNIFSDEVTELELLTDYQRPEKQTFAGTQINEYIDIQTHNRIAEKCKQLNITPYVFYMGCYNILLSKFSNNENICVGMPISGRTSKFLNTIGMFVNTVVLRTNTDGNKTVNELMQEIRESSISAIDNQAYPFGELIKKLNINPSNRNPLFDVMFAYQNESIPVIIFGDKEAESVPVKLSGVKCDLNFNIIPTRDNVAISVEYCTDLYKEETVNKFIKAYTSILTQALNEETLIKDISVLTNEERKTILKEFNDTSVEYPKYKCIHELFEEQVERTPDKVALVASDRTVTYRELNEEANKIANYLIDKGIGKGDIVGINLGRTSKYLISLLGVLKSGAAYLPFDPTHPQERIDSILEDSNAKLCISEEIFNEVLDNSNTQNPNVKISNDSLCYCIYTSGSTGKPKGAMIQHKNLCWYMSSLISIYGNNEIKMPFFTSQSVDLSVTSVFLPLMTGGTTYFYDNDLLNNLSDIFNNEELNIIKLTPTHMQIIQQQIKSKNLENLEHLIVGGEQLYRSTCIDFLEKFGAHIKIHNEYGPTETTVGCGDYVFSYDDASTAVSVGHPTNNVQMYIVDKNINLLPIGVTGELCIAGDGVCAGYLNRPELTAEKFIYNPFGAGKLYKTGDVAYWREDGQICYVGRNDFQVKINGQRIELGEIENAITEVDGVVQCAVIVRKDENNRQYICAFYTGTEINAKDFRTKLSSKLPRYMIPHIFTHMEEMPLTSSGKANRNALPEIDFENISTETEIVSPETEKEKVFADVICSVLRIESINMLDNFFNVGGDSITAIYVVSELEEMGYELHVADIMQSDTLMDVTKSMKSTSNKAIYDQYEVNGFIPFTPIMRAFLKEQKEIPKDFVHTCVVSADCDEEIVKKAINILVSHHDILRGTFTENGIEVLPSNERVPYSFNSIKIEDAEEATKYLKNTKLEEEKLVNIVFCKTEKENFISITVHHFLIDLVSWEVLIKDFNTVVNQIKKNEKITLPAKTASFKLWNEELREYSKTTENKEYWNNINEKLDTTKTLSVNEENEAEEYSIILDENTSNKLINDVNSKYGTRTNEVLLTAVGLAAGHLAKGTVSIAVESHGRTEIHKPIAVERTIGWFTSCYPVVVNKNDNITEELISVKETMRRIPKNGVEYLLMSEGFHKNTDIIFNFFKTSLAEENRKDQTVVFGGTSIFPGKINVNCFDVDSVVTVNISVPKCNHKANISEELGLELQKQIEKIVDVCTETKEVIKTRSDFSDNELTEDELDELRDLFDWGDDDE